MSICSLPRQQDSLNVLFEFIVLVSEQTTMGCTESVRGHVNALNVIEIHTHVIHMSMLDQLCPFIQPCASTPTSDTMVQTSLLANMTVMKVARW